MRFKRSTAVKIIAFLLCVFTLISAALSAAAVYFMAELGFYTRSFEAIRTEHMGKLVSDTGYSIAYMYIYDGTDYLNEWCKYRNLAFEISDRNDERILFVHGGKKGDITKECILDEKDHEGVQYRLKVTVSNTESYEYTDDISILDYWMKAGNTWKYGIVAIAVISVILNLAAFAVLMITAGYGTKAEGTYLNALDRIPYDIFTAIFAGVVFLCLYVGMDFYYGVEESIIACTVTVLFLYPLLLIFLISTASRLKVGGLIKRSFLYNFVKLVLKIFIAAAKGVYEFFANIPLIWKTGLFILCVVFMNAVGMIFIFERPEELGIVLWILSWVAVIGAAYRIAIDFRRIRKGGEALSSGEYDKKIDTQRMMRDFKRHGDELNSIGGSLSHALSEKLKSERFKTELITNVSHDLKTPLTSIINYVDLIKKEEIDNETLKEYIEVLDRQSQKLKKLTEDLVEASKASTGNLAVNFEECELNELLTQMLAEYGEKFDEKTLKVVTETVEGPVNVIADGRHLWRIFDNLMSNIIKYTMPGTRVYIDISKKDGNAEVIFRNISNYPLNKSGSELTERFVRGDGSRHSEGSGLGLSIAKSLAELQNGSLDASTDGDLFKVVLNFPEAKLP
ncbi:MAG: HAMP domain-containing histidine kinase [Ruminococcaceae bacterium]|nr:HAMP domain-containing histidine kinase [Oscillospiraceae bacterium]